MNDDPEMNPNENTNPPLDPAGPPVPMSEDTLGTLKAAVIAGLATLTALGAGGMLTGGATRTTRGATVSSRLIIEQRRQEIIQAQARDRALSQMQTSEAPREQ